MSCQAKVSWNSDWLCKILLGIFSWISLTKHLISISYLSTINRPGCIEDTLWNWYFIAIQVTSVSLMVSFARDLFQAAPDDTKQVSTSRGFIDCLKTSGVFKRAMFRAVLLNWCVLESLLWPAALIDQVLRCQYIQHSQHSSSQGSRSPRSCLSFIRLQAVTIPRAQAEMMHVYCLDFVLKDFIYPHCSLMENSYMTYYM